MDVIENSDLKHILNRMACEFCGGSEMIGHMNEQHVGTHQKFLRGEALWKQMNRHHECCIGMPIHQMERNLLCGVRRVVCR